MSNEIIKILDDLAQRFGVVIDWTAENVLPYIKELFNRVVTYEIVQSSILIAVACAMLIGCMIVAIVVWNNRTECAKTHKQNTFYYWSRGYEKPIFEDGIGVGIVSASLVAGFFAIIILSVNINDLLKWSIIPEWQIVEWLKTNLIT